MCFSPLPTSNGEVIGERGRAKIAASNLWVGGPVPLGYRCVEKKLEIVPEEAETVRTIFSFYLELGSMGPLDCRTRPIGCPSLSFT